MKRRERRIGKLAFIVVVVDVVVVVVIVGDVDAKVATSDDNRRRRRLRVGKKIAVWRLHPRSRGARPAVKGEGARAALWAAALAGRVSVGSVEVDAVVARAIPPGRQARHRSGEARKLWRGRCAAVESFAQP